MILLQDINKNEVITVKGMEKPKRHGYFFCVPLDSTAMPLCDPMCDGNSGTLWNELEVITHSPF